jgi:cell cycle checkpoint protein
LAVIGGKDPTLDLFHAIGKVLYCKRTDEPEQQPLPPHMIKRTRNELVIDPEELLDKIPSSPDSFAAFLHQNYPDFYSNIKDLSQAAENLSIADPFFNEWTVSIYYSTSDVPNNTKIL